MLPLCRYRRAARPTRYWHGHLAASASTFLARSESTKLRGIDSASELLTDYELYKCMRH
jgi:hypothetical protein